MALAIDITNGELRMLSAMCLLGNQICQEIPMQHNILQCSTQSQRCLKINTALDFASCCIYLTHPRDVFSIQTHGCALAFKV